MMPDAERLVRRLFIPDINDKGKLDLKFIFARNGEELHERLKAIVRGIVDSDNPAQRESLYQIYLDLLPDAEGIKVGLK